MRQERRRRVARHLVRQNKRVAAGWAARTIKHRVARHAGRLQPKVRRRAACCEALAGAEAGASGPCVAPQWWHTRTQAPQGPARSAASVEQGSSFKQLPSKGGRPRRATRSRGSPRTHCTFPHNERKIIRLIVSSCAGESSAAAREKCTYGTLLALHPTPIRG
eukprot:359194-Chlamydomonas_euryale.AAC.13